MSAARAILSEHMSRQNLGLETDPLPAPSFKEQLSAHMAKLGAKGGKVSGKKRMTMPKSERIRIASLGAKAMWAKRKKGQPSKG